ncbi:MAG: large conductance mechanosensitive channel protein MscL [Pseudomonadota bacterium]|nr:large conductance mechanosensitive channel protein MscL [Pseudomonadota bacterium]
MKKVLYEYKQFALKGNVLDMAIGIVIGGAFATIASSLVANIFAPIVGLLTSGVDMADLFIVLKSGAFGGPYTTLDQANKDGAVTLSYGLFLNSVLSFLVVSWFAFVVVKSVNRIKKQERSSELKKTKTCPYCCSEIHLEASVCPHCTLKLDGT